ncbi:MAG: oligosaccharide flippase family protein, partial [Candidatus Bathyarchaeia archaeon]
MSTDLNDIAKASARGSFFLFLGKASSTIIMAIASVLVARLLGPENYGLYIIAMIPSSFLITFSNFGISSALIKFCAQFHSERKNKKVVSLIKTGIIFNLIFSILLVLVLLL